MIFRNATFITPEKMDGLPINFIGVFVGQKAIEETRSFPSREDKSKPSPLLNSVAGFFDYLLSQ
jgi:hypothetical protein